MATCDAADALDSAKCYGVLTSFQLSMIQTQLLCQILKASNPMASCDPQELVSDSKCFGCLTPFQLQLIQTQLLCEILHSGGSPGQTCLLCGDGPPTDDATCDCSIYYSNPPNAGVWVWDPVGSAWEMILNPGT